MPPSLADQALVSRRCGALPKARTIARANCQRKSWALSALPDLCEMATVLTAMSLACLHPVKLKGRVIRKGDIHTPEWLVEGEREGRHSDFISSELVFPEFIYSRESVGFMHRSFTAAHISALCRQSTASGQRGRSKRGRAHPGVRTAKREAYRGRVSGPVRLLHWQPQRWLRPHQAHRTLPGDRPVRLHQGCL